MKIFDNSKKVLEEIDRRIRASLEEACIIVEEAAAIKCPKDTGDLEESITYEIDPNGREAKVGSPLEYAPMVELGTVPHEILPKEKQALYWEGAEHPVKRVLHPGTRGEPFLRPALIENLDRVEALIGEQDV